MESNIRTEIAMYDIHAAINLLNYAIGTKKTIKLLKYYIEDLESSNYIKELEKSNVNK